MDVNQLGLFLEQQGFNIAMRVGCPDNLFQERNPLQKGISIEFIIAPTVRDDFVTGNGTSTKGLKTEDASKLLRGDAGTTVHLQIERDGQLMFVAFEPD